MIVEGIRYLKDSETPYTGKAISLYENGQKKQEVNWKDDRIGVDEWHRFLRSMPDEPYKFLKELPEEDLRVWLYAYDHYREAKESLHQEQSSSTQKFPGHIQYSTQ